MRQVSSFLYLTGFLLLKLPSSLWAVSGVPYEVEIHHRLKIHSCIQNLRRISTTNPHHIVFSDTGGRVDFTGGISVGSFSPENKAPLHLADFRNLINQEITETLQTKFSTNTPDSENSFTLSLSKASSSGKILMLISQKSNFHIPSAVVAPYDLDLLSYLLPDAEKLEINLFGEVTFISGTWEDFIKGSQVRLILSKTLQDDWEEALLGLVNKNYKAPPLSIPQSYTNEKSIQMSTTSSLIELSGTNEHLVMTGAPKSYEAIFTIHGITKRASD